MVAVRHLSTMTVATGVDSTGLGRWAWMHLGGGRKATCVLVAYRSCQPHCNTGRDTLWDQHLCYFEAQGNTQSLIQNFHDDLVFLLTELKHAGYKIVIMGDFNKDVSMAFSQCIYPLKLFDYASSVYRPQANPFL
jgi:hypothetical protein